MMASQPGPGVRRRILFLSQCLPFPPHSGVTRRTYHILHELQRQFDVTLVPFSRRFHQADAPSVARGAAALREELSDVMDPVRIKSDYSLARKLRNHAWSVLSREPYIYQEYGDARFGQELQKGVVRARPDLVHLDSLDLYRWLPFLPVAPIACTHHNLESELLRLQADHFPNRVVRSYMKHQADLVEKVERRLCPRFDLNVMTSEVDEERLHALAPGSRTTVIPNGVDVDFFRPGSPEQVAPGRVAFLGPTYMFPNRDAVDFFLAAMWPFIRERSPDSTFHIIGKNSVDEKARFESHPRVTCNGHVPDIRPHFAEAAVSIVPIRIGGGTRLKILDAWSMGKAVVSTSVGCEGLDTVDGRNILIRDDPMEFAAAVVEVLRDRDLRDGLGREARKTAEQRYAWRVVGRKLVSLYQDLIAVAARNPVGERAASGHN
jgi:glycosyltransferase involved in cell wall biosynthesis